MQHAASSWICTCRAEAADSSMPCMLRKMQDVVGRVWGGSARASARGQQNLRHIAPGDRASGRSAQCSGRTCSASCAWRRRITSTSPCARGEAAFSALPAPAGASAASCCRALCGDHSTRCAHLQPSHNTPHRAGLARLLGATPTVVHSAHSVHARALGQEWD